MNTQKKNDNIEIEESTPRIEKVALGAALIGLAAFTGMVGSVEAAVGRVQENVQTLRRAEPGTATGQILGSAVARATDSTIASLEYGQSYTQQYTQGYTQSYTEGIKPANPPGGEL